MTPEAKEAPLIGLIDEPVTFASSDAKTGKRRPYLGEWERRSHDGRPDFKGVTDVRAEARFNHPRVGIRRDGAVIGERNVDGGDSTTSIKRPRRLAHAA